MKYRLQYFLSLLLSGRLGKHCLVTLGFLLTTSQAHAHWTIASADSVTTVIRGTNLYQLRAGEPLRDEDLIESPLHSVVQLQDDAGNLLALGAQTRVLLQTGSRVSLLDGWLKVAHGCTAQPCAVPVVDTERGTVELGTSAAAIVAALPVGTAGTVAIAVFSESGTQTLTASPRQGAALVHTAIAPGHFAYFTANAPPQVSPRPSSAFLADMPIAFRDALQRMPTAPGTHESAIKPLRAATYDDVSAWLLSALPARKRFAVRFRPRLADPAFRHAVDQNLKALPEWRVLLYPPAPKSDARLRAIHLTPLALPPKPLSPRS
jgi:hypothetical protein